MHLSQIPTPQMTELEFWAALVSDYPSTAGRLPTLTTAKIRGGIPPPLRGVVWPSIAGAQDPDLMTEYQRLSLETSPYDAIIGKDIGRSYPNVEMFRDPHGEGQKMLANVLKCYSLYDEEIGYCQGLGFVVGPLLMHMSDAESFCVLVRLMDHYDLRSCFLPTLSGLQLRTYQFQHLMRHHLPKLYGHLGSLGTEPVYVSQWFLSFFGVTCPLPMLLRIYDVLLVEGACETLMRVALSLMQRNEAKLLACTEYSDVMQLLLSRSLWDTYAYNADELVRDFVGLTALVTRESLASLEEKYRQGQRSGSGSVDFPALQSTAARFLGRLWAGSSSNESDNSHNNSSSSSTGSNPSGTTSTGLLSATLTSPHQSSKRSSIAEASTMSTTAAQVRDKGRDDSDNMKRVTSKQSMASTLNSIETTASDVSTAPTESCHSASDTSAGAVKFTHPNSELNVRRRQNTVTSSRNKDRDRDLHAQIEDLLMALSELQRAQAELAHDLQREREEREEDHRVSNTMLAYIKERPDGPDGDKIIERATERFVTSAVKDANRTPVAQSKTQLQEDVAYWKDKHTVEAQRCHELTRTLDEKESAMSTMREELREARARLQDSYGEKQRQERLIKDLRQNQQDVETKQARRASMRNSLCVTGGGLRELKLGRTDSSLSQASSSRTTSSPVSLFSKRASSLGFPSSLQSSVSSTSIPLVADAVKDSSASPSADVPESSVASASPVREAEQSAPESVKQPSEVTPDVQTDTNHAGVQSTKASAPQESQQPQEVPEPSQAIKVTLQQPSQEQTGEQRDADALLAELVQAKTAEAVARQELEEVKAKLESFRRLLSHDGADALHRSVRRTPSPDGSIRSVQSGPAQPVTTSSVPDGKASAATTASASSIFSFGWGKRAATTK
ncbi:ecotropic viral integration site [Ascosphaera acerosa]|nr:ecotropic viral integration site [Ascosphaera acerosa]